jgi:alanine dehydrogenase
MIIGIPKEIKDHEFRVALTPLGAAWLTAEGHRVLVQRHAGTASGFPDEEYTKSGTHLVGGPEEILPAPT